MAGLPAPLRDLNPRAVPLYLLALAAPISVSAAGIATGLVIVAGLVCGARERGRAAWPPRAVTISLLALFGAYFLATLLANPFAQHWHKFGEELWIKLLILAVPLLAGDRPETAVRALKIVLWVGGVSAVYGIWLHFSGWDPIRGESLVDARWGHASVSGFFSHHLAYGGQLLVMILMAAAWFAAGASAWLRRRLAVLLLLLLLALLWSHARSSQLGTVVGGAVLLLLVPGRRHLKAGALAALLAAALLLPSVRVHLGRLLDLDGNMTRLNLWRSSLVGIGARPLLGFGPGNFREMMALHEIPGVYDTRAHSHHDLLMHGVNAGLGGIAAALALLATTVREFARSWREGAGRAWIGAGAIAVQAGITAAGFFQVYQTDDEVEILLYFVLGCALAASGRGQTGGRVPH